MENRLTLRCLRVLLSFDDLELLRGSLYQVWFWPNIFINPDGYRLVLAESEDHLAELILRSQEGQRVLWVYTNPENVEERGKTLTASWKYEQLLQEMADGDGYKKWKSLALSLVKKDNCWIRVTNLSAAAASAKRLTIV
jgi:hypothetical protein